MTCGDVDQVGQCQIVTVLGISKQQCIAAASNTSPRGSVFDSRHVSAHCVTDIMI